VLRPGARIVVAELVLVTLAWARGSMGELFGTSLTDRRLTILESDVGHLIGRSTFDAILLDVDNGPEGLTFKGDGALHNVVGSRALALRCVRVA
jgi:spermidine synthase